MDLEESDKKKYLALVSLAGVIAFLIFVFLLIFIWTRPIKKEKNVSTAESKLGSYSPSSYTLDDQINDYAKNISLMIKSNEASRLYKMLNEEYIKFKGFDEKGFENYLASRNFQGKDLSLIEYKSTSLNGMNLFKFLYRTKEDENKELIVNVFEKSPNNYTISFDNLVSYSNTEKKYENNGLKIVLSNITMFSNEFRCNIKITNIDDSNIILNSEKAAESIYLGQGSETDILVSTNLFMGKELVLKPNDSINYSIRFLLSDFSFGNVKKIIIKDVINESTNNKQNVEINLNE